MTINEAYMWLANVLQVNIFHVVILGGGGYLLRGVIDKKHKKDILRYQEELSQHTERLKHELDKNILSAERLIKTQHEIYPTVYEKLVVALGAVQASEMTGYFLTSFDGFTDQEICDIVGDMKITEQFKNEISALIADDHNKAFDKYREYAPLHYANAALEAIQAAMNEWLKKELFFSEPSNALIREALTNMRIYARSRQHSCDPRYAKHTKDHHEKLEDAEELLRKLKEQLLKDLQGQICR